MRQRQLSNVIGFDDAPAPRGGSAPVRLIGAVCARTRLDGVCSGFVQPDGDDATEVMLSMLEASPFAASVQAILLQGIAVAGFNVVDARRLAERSGRPVLVIARRMPGAGADESGHSSRLRAALCARPGGHARWARIEALGPSEALEGLAVQRAGLSREEARALICATRGEGKLPEPLRLAHIIAGGVTLGASHGRA